MAFSKEEVTKTIIEQIPKLRNRACKFCSIRADQEDLVQETLIKAINSDAPTEFNSINGLMGWLYLIMKNTYINTYRRMIVRGKHEDMLDIQTTAQSIADTSMMAEDIQKIIESMPVRLIHVMKLYILGYKYHEIGKILNCNIGTVKSRLFLGRQYISNKLKQNGKEILHFNKEQ